MKLKIFIVSGPAKFRKPNWKGLSRIVRVSDTCLFSPQIFIFCKKVQGLTLNGAIVTSTSKVLVGFHVGIAENRGRRVWHKGDSHWHELHTELHGNQSVCSKSRRSEHPYIIHSLTRFLLSKNEKKSTNI
jgi:hypothetical protein